MTSTDAPPVAPPAPSPHGLTGQFYEHLKTGAAHFQRCSDCGRWQFPPREICPRCASETLVWTPSSGRGEVVTWTVARRPMHPGFLDVPFVVGAVTLAEGPTVMGRFLDADDGELQIGQHAEIVITPSVTDDPVVAFRRIVK